ncbi:ethylbenzene dehydrogenase-related protein [Marinobacterium weihaiense]|uniref:Dimethylsulfide dehydrogenase n=1 Tax=Marinobacterium weihaiense TaxID=2851016 RepID=A0ABS6MDY7_9GAMM|nr:ethylbenzene dehydrogenase-related protein [Marinobacterium weihaiense]MBV0934522.1 dimethylsulfide dehydrogenase [Marinobacterium weihaiense]
MTIHSAFRHACLLGLVMAFGLPVHADHSELNPNAMDVKPGDTVKVSRIPGTIYLRTQNDPDDLIWDRLPLYRIELMPAPPVHTSVILRMDPTANTPKHLYFQVARSDERFYVRLRWKDATENRATAVDRFRDGAAVQYALKGSDTSLMMGTGPDNAVNIWYWRADEEQAENLAAGGFGSTTRLTEQPVSGASAYIREAIAQDSEWHVVMSRPLKVDGEHQVDLEREAVPVMFALWQGDTAQRDGDKRISQNWIMLDTTTAP